jgi:hypothetical protein
MIIKVRVIPNSKTESVLCVDEANYRLKVREKAIEGRANEAVVEALASYFKVRKSDITIVGGLRSRDKTIEIADRT